MRDAGSEIPKRKWGLLYGLVTLLVGLFGLVESGVPSEAVRHVLEILVTVMIFGAMAIWVRVNRASLDVAGPRRVPWMPHETVGTRAASSASAPEPPGPHVRAIDAARGARDAKTQASTLTNLPYGR